MCSAPVTFGSGIMIVCGGFPLGLASKTVPFVPRTQPLGLGFARFVSLRKFCRHDECWVLTAESFLKANVVRPWY